MTKHTELIFDVRLPCSVTPTLCLLRRYARLSRELTDNVVRARGHVTREFHADDVSVYKEEPCFDGKREGLVRMWYDDGRQWIETPYVNNRAHGLERMWWGYEGEYGEHWYVNGELHGFCRHWHEDGTLAREIRYQILD